MAKITIVFSILLILLGVVGYLGTPAAPEATTTTNSADDTQASADGDDEKAKPAKRSVTALIPSFVGLLMMLFGFLALNEKMRMHAMHGAVLVGLLGCLAGLGRGAMGLGKFFSGDPSLNQRSFLFVWLMAFICAAFVVVCVNSFIAARRNREKDAV